jgi:hypothetical protein
LKIKLDKSQIGAVMDAKIKTLEKELRRLVVLLDQRDRKIAQLRSSLQLTKDSKEQLLTRAKNLVEALEDYNVV